ncbi:MAG TPA: hypothetical protein VKB20_08535 [Steroidobacteraceae bacterium]|nr:hypothetical protein [Steroidobacteraceae bacterium]
MPDFPGRSRLRAPAFFVLLVAVACAAPARSRIEQALGIAPRDPSVH